MTETPKGMQPVEVSSQHMDLPKPPSMVDGQGNQVAMQPVKMSGKCNIGHHEIIKHMRSAMRLKHRQFYRREGHDGEAVLVGTGPSVDQHVEDIRRLQKDGCTVFAIKGAHNWLLDHGIRPDVAIAVDGQQKIANLYQNPQADCMYLIASQCHPDVYEALKDELVIVWHCYTDKAHKYWANWLKRKKRDDKIFFVQGGSTSGMRGITLAYLCGFRKLNLFGYDSCLRVPEGFRVDDHGAPMIKPEDQLLKITGEKNEKELLVAVVEDRKFFCDPAMALQGNEFIPQVQAMGDVRVRVFGDGFIPHASRVAAKQGDPRFLFADEDWDDLSNPLRGTQQAPQQIQMPTELQGEREVAA